MSISFDKSVTTNLDEALRREWLETNGLGGWASSTLAGAHTRRYHGLLVAALKPPVGRHVLLSKLDETLVVSGDRHDLGCNRYPGAVHPQGFRRLERFTKGLFPVFDYEAGGVRLRKTIAAIHGENTTTIVYEVLEAPAAFTLELRPFVAFRDHHALSHANAFLRSACDFQDGVLRARPYDGVPELFLAVPGARFDAGGDWYFNLEYDAERERGLEFREDLFSHGVFAVPMRVGDRLGVIASTASPAGRDGVRLLEQERRRREKILAPVRHLDEFTQTLALAADQFVVRRGESERTVIAGYPWFTDWGRDAMIALPGLCLATKRLDDAKAILRAFARHADQGMIPSRFAETGTEAEYGAVDATLWFFVAVHQYLEGGGDEAFVLDEILPVLRNAAEWYGRGTRHGIRADEDGLLTAGEPGTQLTWMDAKVGDRPVTPRYGKCVEVNALWHSALSILADLTKRAGDSTAAKDFAARAKQVKAKFEEVFWNEEAGCLYDVVDGDRRDASIRPNQVFALSLPYPVLSREKGRAVLKVVEEKLLTPVGLRSLAPEDPSYRPTCTGGPAERDAAYHQGTVWSWLLGPYAAALVKTLGAVGKPKARKAVEAILPHLAEAGIGTLSEIFDAEPPHAARGCIAQAWSVGEICRVWTDLMAEPAAKAKPKAATTKKSYKIVTPKEPGGARRRSKPKEAE